MKEYTDNIGRYKTAFKDSGGTKLHAVAVTRAINKWFIKAAIKRKGGKIILTNDEISFFDDGKVAITELTHALESALKKCGIVSEDADCAININITPTDDEPPHSLIYHFPQKTNAKNFVTFLRALRDNLREEDKAREAPSGAVAPSKASAVVPDKEKSGRGKK